MRIPITCEMSNLKRKPSDAAVEEDALKKAKPAVTPAVVDADDDDDDVPEEVACIFFYMCTV